VTLIKAPAPAGPAILCGKPGHIAQACGGITDEIASFPSVTVSL
jgi:hypothetical protein